MMKDIGLSEFGTPDNFIDLSDIVKSHAKQYFLWTKELAKMTDARPGKVIRFTKHLIRARTMLQQLDSNLAKYRVHTVDIRGIYAAAMEQNRSPWAQTCDELFVNWSEYERTHPFQEISWVDC
jgi:hypothetical protein